MMSEWFIEDMKTEIVTYLKLEEVLFNKVNVLLYYSYKGQYYPTKMSVDYYEPSGEYREITLENAPLLLNCHIEFQLIQANLNEVIVANQEVLNDLFVEAQNMLKLTKVEDRTYRLKICDYNKLINAHAQDNISNHWIVFRNVPDYKRSLDYLISMEFIPNSV